MESKERLSNIELLRILSMLMVIGLHCNYVSLGIPTEHTLSANTFGECLRIVIENACLVSVNVYVLISGYFGIHLKAEKVFRYLFQVFFFASIVVLFAVFLYDEDLSYKEIAQFYYSYFSFNWFVSSYFALLLLAPLVNSFVDKNNTKIIVKMVLLFFFVDSFLGYLLPNIKGIGALNGYSLLHVLFVYSIGRLLYVIRNSICYKSFLFYFGLFIACVLINSVISIFLYIGVTQKWNPIAYNNPFVVMGAVFFFLIFLKLKIRNNHFVNVLATSAFAAFLIHANSLNYPHFIQWNTNIYHNSSGLIMFCLFIFLAILIYIFAFLINQIQIKCYSFFRLLWGKFFL